MNDEDQILTVIMGHLDEIEMPIEVREGIGAVTHLLMRDPTELAVLRQYIQSRQMHLAFMESMDVEVNEDDYEGIK